MQRCYTVGNNRKKEDMTMQPIIAGLLAALLTLSPVQGVLPTPEAERITVTGELRKLENPNWIGLTNTQMLEDFDYLYKVLDENYPYFAVAKRMSGTGLRETYAARRAEMQQCKSDIEFFLTIDDWLRKDGAQAGHLGLLFPSSYEWCRDIYTQLAASPDDPYAEAYSNARSQKSYEAFGKLFDPVYERVMQYYSGEEAAQSESLPNVETKILEPGKIAYVNIRTFDMTFYDEDEKTLKDFYKQVGAYDHLIIDISQNGGGGMAYFDNLIMEPNIDKPLDVQTYNLFKNGPLVQKFLGTDEWLKEPSMTQSANQFPQFVGFDRNDLKDCDYFFNQTITENPAPGQQKLFQGKIWLLVSENVYSSSEWAAMVSKTTGFATLVGRQTSGDGIGTDPIPVVLPNSGLIVRFSPIYGVTGEGRGSEEYGTTPDILSPDGETPLETCLKAIKGLQ